MKGTPVNSITDSFVWDNHGCMPLRPDGAFLPQLERYKKAGVHAVTLNVTFDIMPFEHGFRMLSFFRSWLKERKDQYLLVNKTSDLLLAKSSRRLAVVFDIEGANAIGNQLDLVELYYDLGVRWMSLAYNKTNRVAGGCQDQDPGLSPFGRQLLRKMKEVGMIVCCSHTGRKSTLDACRHAGTRVILSHSNPYALCAHPRNVSDDVIRAIADTGGVIGINGIGLFLGHNDITADRFVDHIEYVADLVGIKHVGLGLDYMFDQEETAQLFASRRDIYPVAQYGSSLKMVKPEQLPEITNRMRARGYKKSEVKAILGGNLLRVAKEVWR